MLSRLFRSQSPDSSEELNTQSTLARARQWQRWLRWLAWLVPVAISVGVYVFVWYRLLLPGQAVVDFRQSSNIIFVSALVALIVGIFIYQIQIIFSQQVAASANLEKKVQERTQHITEVMLKLDEQNKALVALDKQKSEFVTLVSHELRAPLTNINGGLELLLSRDHELSQGTRETLKLVTAEAGRLTRFVETILSVSTLDSGQLPVVLGPVEVAPAVGHVVGQFTSRPEAQLISDLEPNLPLIVADEHYLQSVIFHLVDNSLKYAPNSPVWISAWASEGGVAIEVKDHGPGIPPEEAVRLFSKFERLEAEDSQTVYGYGLGLYMCKRILEVLNGKIWLSPAPGSGAAFELWLPAWHAPAENLPSQNLENLAALPLK